jgi:endonuclease/exonuclease/phosphatase family metal-dependent hydrolase
MAASKATYPAPGAWVHGDHRPRGADKTSVRHGQGRALRLVQWNIERGYELHRIIDVLREVKGDVLALQELDIGCERTGFVDVCDRIARELGMAYVFCTEFVEHHSPLRSARNQGGGAHGNAVLSRFDLELEGVRVIRNHQPFPWQARGGEFGEPRDGFRNTLAVPVATPQGRLLVYSCHMELFCGIADRVRIFSEILEHARERAPDTPHQCIMGDFNTMAHSIARLSPNYCNDHLRFTTLGYDEAEWWSRHLLSFYDHHGEINHRLARALRKPWRLLGGGGGGGGGGAAAAAAAGGSGAHALPVDDKVLRAARNPGFYDPFDVLHDITLTNYRGLFVGKLDWTLLRGMECVGRGIDNHDYRASDHKLLYVDVVLDPPHEVEARIRLPHRRTRGSRSRCRIATAVLALLALVLLAYALLPLGRAATR